MIRLICVSAGVLAIGGLYLAPVLSEVTVSSAEAQSTETAPASSTASRTNNWFSAMNISFERQNRVTPGGISDAEAIDIAMERGAAIREARESGRELSEIEIASIGVESLQVAEPAADTVLVASADATATALPETDTAQAPAQVAEVAQPSESAVPSDLWKVTGTSVNLREGPGTSYAVITKAALDDRVIALTDTSAEWIEIQYPSGQTAWIFSEFLEPAEG